MTVKEIRIPRLADLTLNFPDGSEFDTALANPTAREIWALLIRDGYIREGAAETNASSLVITILNPARSERR